jgi:hypothetical protein
MEHYSAAQSVQAWGVQSGQILLARAYEMKAQPLVRRLAALPAHLSRIDRAILQGTLLPDNLTLVLRAETCLARVSERVLAGLWGQT